MVPVLLHRSLLQLLQKVTIHVHVYIHVHVHTQLLLAVHSGSLLIENILNRQK